jgi:hypothetical protein
MLSFDLGLIYHFTLLSALLISSKRRHICEISGFPCDVVETIALLGCYAAWFGIWLPMFRNTYRTHLQSSNGQ